MAEELLPINNISYHFVKTANGCTSEKVISTSITCNNFDELLNDLKTKKEFIHKNKYSDIFISCSSLNKDLYSSTYLWYTDYKNNSDKIYKLKLYDIIMSSKQTKESKPVNSSPVKESKSSNPKSSNPFIPKDPEVSIPPSFIKKETTPKTNKSDPNEHKQMDLSDVLRLLSQKLPMEQPNYQPIKQDDHAEASCFDSNPNDDIVITSNKPKKKEPEKKPEPKRDDHLKDDHPEVKCFKVRFTPDDKPEIVNIPLNASTKSPEKSEQIPEKKPEQDSEKKPDTDSFYDLIQFLSKIIEDTEKKPEQKQEPKPVSQPKPFTKPIPPSLKTASNTNKKSESKKSTSTNFESKPEPNPFYKNETNYKRPMFDFPFNKMDQIQYENPFMRMFYYPEQNNLNHNRTQPEAKKRAREPFMSEPFMGMYPFLI